MIRKIITVLALVSCVFSAKGLELSVFRVGNSLTDGLVWPAGAWKRDCFVPYVESGSNGFSNIDGATVAGAPLSWTWNEEVAKYQGLTNSGWDVLVLQTYGRMFYDSQYPGTHSYAWGSVTNAVNFIQLALQNNPDIQVYIYSHWPQPEDHWRYEQYLDWVNPETGVLYTKEEAADERVAARAAFDFVGEWEVLYTNWTAYSTRSRDYYEKLIQELERQNLSLTKPIRMIPAGDVMYALHQKMQNGDLSGYTNIVQVYQDVPHLRPGIGRLIMAATWYAALFQESPENLDYTAYNCSDTNDVVSVYGSLDAPYYIDISPAYASLVQSTAWEVVKSHPFAGIAPIDHDRDSLPNDWETQYFGGYTNALPQDDFEGDGNSNWQEYVAGLNPTNADRFTVSWSSQNGLSWNSFAGRSYNVYWTSNLMNSFQLVQSNAPAGAFSNVVPGFYRIDVRLAQ